MTAFVVQESIVAVRRLKREKKVWQNGFILLKREAQICVI